MELKKQDGGVWVKASEILPDLDDNGFSADVKIKMNSKWVGTGYYDGFTKKWYQWAHNDFTKMVDNVTHWKPSLRNHLYHKQ